MLSNDEFLKILGKILSNKNLLEIEKKRLENIIENQALLNKHEEITTEILINKLDLINLNTVTDEDGYFKEFVKIIDQEGTATETEIFYLLKKDQTSCLHKLEMKETWSWLGGDDILIFIFENDKVSEIRLNAENLNYDVPANTLFGAKLASSNNENFAWVICRCKPGFIPEYYKNPSQEELDYLFKTYPNYIQVIEELTPKIYLNNKNFFQTIIKFFTCCIGVKKIEEQEPLIHNPSQGNR